MAREKQNGSRTSTIVTGLALMLLLGGCSTLTTSPTSVSDQTNSGISIIGGGEELYGQIDRDWQETNTCWGSNYEGAGISVQIMPQALKDSGGLQVFQYEGGYYYGLRQGDNVKVCNDLAALKHEFSHVIGERVTGQLVANNSGKCWL